MLPLVNTSASKTKFQQKKYIYKAMIKIGNKGLCSYYIVTVTTEQTYKVQDKMT